jgi:outer membrane protein assembly factor BamD (BamD/ComL family)
MNKIASLFLAALLVVSCSNGSSADDQLSGSRDEQITQLKKWQGQMLKLEALDTALARKTAAGYQQFITDFPEDTLVPVLLKKQGDLYRAWPGKEKEALAAYQRLIEDFEQHPFAPEALFAASFVYEAQGDKNRQAGAYRMFLRKYPNHPMANDAKNLLVMVTDVNQSDLDRVKEWKRAAKANDSTAKNK